MKNISLGDFLTDAELLKIMQMKDRRQICDEVIKPNIDRINKALGQENDPDYLSYAIEYSLSARRVSMGRVE